MAQLLTLDSDPKVLQHRVQAIGFHSQVVLQHKHSGKLLTEVRDAVAGARQAFENESNRSGAVVGQLNLRNRYATTAFASEDGVMFKDRLGYVSLSDLGANNRSPIARSD